MIQAVGVNRPGGVGARSGRRLPEASGVRFGGIYEDLLAASELHKLTSQQEKLKEVLDPENVLLTIHGKPLGALDLLEIIQQVKAQTFKSDMKLGKWFSGGIGVFTSPLALAGLGLIPLVFAGGSYGLFYAFMKLTNAAGLDEIKSLEPELSRSFEAKLGKALEKLCAAGLVKAGTFGYSLTPVGKKVLKTGGARTSIPGSAQAALSGAQAQKPALAGGTFSYEGLSKATRLAFFKTMLSKNADGKISGFQVLEKLGTMIKNQSWVMRFLKKGMTEEELWRQFVSVGDTKTDGVWIQHKLKTFEAMGLVQQVDVKKGQWALTPQGKTAIEQGDPVYSGVIQPEDLHEIFQQGIDFLEAEKVRQFQQLEKVQAEYREVVASIPVLEARVKALQAGASAAAGQDAVPAWIQLDRAKKELDLKQKWVERFKLAVEGRELVYKKFKEAMDATVTHLMEGQLKVRILGLDHSTAEIMGHLVLKDGSSLDSAASYLTRWYVQQMRENPQVVGGMEMQDLLAHVDVGLMAQASPVSQEAVDLMVQADEVIAKLKAEGTIQEKKNGQ